MPGARPRPAAGAGGARLPGCPSARLPGCPAARQPVSPSARLPVSPSARQPGCPAARLPGCPAARLPGCPAARLPVRRVPGAYARVAAYNGVQGAQASSATLVAVGPLACAVGLPARAEGHSAGRLAANRGRGEAPRAGPARPRYSYSSPHTKFFLLKKPAYR